MSLCRPPAGKRERATEKAPPKRSRRKHGIHRRWRSIAGSPIYRLRRHERGLDLRVVHRPAVLYARTRHAAVPLRRLPRGARRDLAARSALTYYRAPEADVCMNSSRFVLATASVSLALALFAGAAIAQGYPAKPIRMIVPFPPGGGTDIAARTIANMLSGTVKWTFVVENKPGAGGNLGVEQAVKSPADGYTLVIGQTSNLAINPALHAKLPYDPLRDLIPVALIVSAPVVFVVAASSRYTSLGDLLAAAKTDPGGVTLRRRGTAPCPIWRASSCSAPPASSSPTCPTR